MKKKTVITTEKREVCVIRQPHDEMTEKETPSNDAGSSADSLIALLDQPKEADSSHGDQD